MRLTSAGTGSLLLAAAIVSAARPVAAVAQGRPSADLFLLQNEALVGSGPLYGIGFATGGAVGIRVSAAGGFANHVDEYGEERYGLTGFGADADVVLSADGALAGLLGLPVSTGRAGIIPYAFAGIGVIGRRVDESFSMNGDGWERGPSMSFGGGITTPLGTVLGIDASARYRMPVADSSQWVDMFPRGWEYRVGFKLHLGGSRGTTSGTRGRTTSRPSTRESTRGRGGGSVLEELGTILTGGGSTVAASAEATRVVNTADDYLGVPYVWGGETPRGFDCSGFTRYVYAKNGVKLPRVSRDQAKVGDRVMPALNALRVGDLLFFAQDYSRVDHVAIYIGNDRIIHATSSGGEVRYDDLRSDRGAWFVDHMVAARRVLGGSTDWETALAPLVNRVVKEFDKGDKAPKIR